MHLCYRPPRPGVETTRITDTLMLCFRLTHDSTNDSDFLTLKSDMYLVNDEAWYHILSSSDRCIRDSTLYDARATCQGLHTVQGLLATSPRPSPTCPHPSKRGTEMTRALATRSDRPITDIHPRSTIAFAGIYASRRRSHQTLRREGEGIRKRVEKDTKQNKTRKGI
jgi:hypothetical protein